MPKEQFFAPTQTDGEEPALIVRWGERHFPDVLVNETPLDRSGLNRLIAVLRRARNQTFGVDE